VSNIVASTQMNSNYNSQESTEDYDPKLSYPIKRPDEDSQNESLIFNNRNRERYSILEQIEQQRIEEFKNKGKKTLL
jgi:hemolysin activation/secretion protein